MVPDDYEVLTAFAMGYKGEPELLEDNFQEMEKAKRQRIELKEILFEGEFGNTSAIAV